MHILVVTPYFPPEVNACATRQFEHCRRWVAAGHQVTVITPAPNAPNGVLFAGFRNRWKAETWIDGIRIIRVWTLIRPNKGVLWRSLSFLSFMLRATCCACFVRDVDVLVATSGHFFSGLAGMLIRWLTRLPFVLEIRDVWPESIVAVGAMNRSIVIRTLEWLERRMYASAHHIVTVGEGYRQLLLQRGVAPEKLTIVSNGVDLTCWQPRLPDAKLRRSWSADGGFVCAYVGTVGMAHGLEVVLHAAERLKKKARFDVKFLIVGDGAKRTALQLEAQRQGLDNVIFAGELPRDQVPNVLASCNAALVHLRGTELFGTVVPSKIFETMALNTPIIMGVRGLGLEIVLKARAGVAMTPDDPDSLLHAIDHVCAYGDSYRHGRQYARQFYDRDKLANKMLTILARLASPTAERGDEDYRMGISKAA
jgi:glycosyltransferase involved in cell wall biosynthesis